jgi:shikimate dehydrogenase
VRSLYVLLGDPVAHSRSPAIHARAFALLGIDAVYAPCRVRRDELPKAIQGLRALGVAGFNVTIPHKEDVARLVDRRDAAASEIGAVSCVLRDGEELAGFNTDAPGLLRALRAYGVERGGAKVVVVGAGGSARGVAWALAPLAGQMTNLNRTRSKADAVAALARAGGCDDVRTGGLETALDGAGIVVQCTSIGLGTDEMPFDPSGLPKETVLVDLVYGPRGPTALLRAASCRTIDGLDILVHQAIASLELWLGRPHLDALAPDLRKAALA